VSKTQRVVLVVSILASFVAFLDGSVVNVALPAISRNLGGGLDTQQWVVDAYLITLGSLILLAGSLSDIFGRRRVMAAGLIGFGVASILCAVAPSSLFLISSRALQGIAGALLVPSSLALIISSFSGAPQAKAIGTWTAWTGIAFIIGPLLGGFLVDTVSWRMVFAINIVPIVVCLWLLAKLKGKESLMKAKLDILGAVLCSVGLGGSVYALIEQPHKGWNHVLAPLIIGVLSLVAFVIYEKRTPMGMLPLKLFKVRNFSVGNIATFGIYGGLSIATFLIVIFLQQVSGYSALDAGLALLPVTAIMFVLSPRFGALSGKYGPRWFMTFGPIVAGGGFLLMTMIKVHVTYWSQLLPGILVFALGLSMTVAPLTSAILGAIDKRNAGIASAVNNAIARIAGLITIAFVGLIVGSTHLDLKGFKRAIVVTALMVIAGGLVSAVGISNKRVAQAATEPKA
jgi:EmrB/QacA subfamily drug resistance transporter